MSFKSIVGLSLLATSSVWAAHYHPPHTDGIEPYYQEEGFSKWVETVPEELRPTLFAKEGAMEW